MHIDTRFNIGDYVVVIDDAKPVVGKVIAILFDADLSGRHIMYHVEHSGGWYVANRLEDAIFYNPDDWRDAEDGKLDVRRTENARTAMDLWDTLHKRKGTD